MSKPILSAAAPRANWPVFAVLAALCLSNAPFWWPGLADVITGLLSGMPDRALANRDFANYWLAGRLGIDGQVMALFDQPSHQAALEAAQGLGTLEIRAWSYPPHMLLMTLPLGLLPYPVAYAVFMLASGAFFIAAAHTFIAANGQQADRVGIWLLMIPFFAVQVLTGQNGFLFGGVILLALAWRQASPVLTGLMLAILTMKPQLGFLFPVLLLAERNYAAIAWTLVFTALLAGLSILAFGPAPWVAFWHETIPYQQFVATEWTGVFLRMMPTWFGALRAAGVSSETALLVHLLAAVPIAGLAVWGIFRARDAHTRTGLVIVATVLVTPYTFHYDLGPLMVLAATYLLSEHGEPARRWEGFILAAVLALPLWMPILVPSAAAPVLARSGLLLPPILLLGVFVLIIRRAWPRPNSVLSLAR